jgi:protoporphyrinogen oxidase
MGFYFENKLMIDINDIVINIEKILKNNCQIKNNMYFDEWYLSNFGKEKLYISKGVLKAITFSDSSKILAEYGIYILETFFEECYTLKSGLQKLMNSLSQGINITNSTVQKLIFKNDRIIEIKTDQNDIDTSKDLVIITTPPGNIEIQNHQELLKLLSKIKYSGCAVIIFKIKRDFLEKPDYIFFPEEKYKISVIEKMKINEDIFLGCLIPYNHEIDRDKIILYSIDFLGKFLKCNFNEQILDTFYQSWDKGLPLVDKNYIKTINKLNIMNFDNLLFAGDYTTLLPSMESAVISGIETVKKIDQFLTQI